MKRRNFILLFGTLLILIGGYASWCGRQFFLRSEIVYGPDVPDEARTTIEKSLPPNLFFPPRFTWNKYSHLLKYPYESAPHQITTTRTSTTQILVNKDGITIEFVGSKEGSWTFGSVTGRME